MLTEDVARVTEFEYLGEYRQLNVQFFLRRRVSSIENCYKKNSPPPRRGRVRSIAVF